MTSYTILLAIFTAFLVGFKACSAMFSSQINDYPAITTSQNLQPLDQLSAPEQGTITEITATRTNPQTTATRTVSRQTTTAPCNNYYGYLTIGGKNICLVATNTTNGTLSYSHAYTLHSSNHNSYNQYIFGHNSANIFGNLANLPAGATFSLTTNGQTANYRISFKETTCDYSNPSYPCSQFPNDPVLNMLDVVNPSRRGAHLAIMTCAGTPIGNGDATHRLTVYAVKI